MITYYWDDKSESISRKLKHIPGKNSKCLSNYESCHWKERMYFLLKAVNFGGPLIITYKMQSVENITETFSYLIIGAF
jgi:hypothetical protein